MQQHKGRVWLMLLDLASFPTGVPHAPCVPSVRAVQQTETKRPPLMTMLDGSSHAIVLLRCAELQKQCVSIKCSVSQECKFGKCVTPRDCKCVARVGANGRGLRRWKRPEP